MGGGLLVVQHEFDPSHQIGGAVSLYSRKGRSDSNLNCNNLKISHEDLVSFDDNGLPNPCELNMLEHLIELGSQEIFKVPKNLVHTWQKIAISYNQH